MNSNDDLDDLLQQAQDTIQPSENDVYDDSFEPDHSKQPHEWRDELIATSKGKLLNKGYGFWFQGQAAPVKIQIADTQYQQVCGTNPRLSVFSDKHDDPKLAKVLEKYGLQVVYSRGYAVSGFDFRDRRSVESLIRALTHIVIDYAKM
ncbi:hypothetical protein [Endozoicomonas sp. ALB032]|uniref:hypothetical protein n=1 Tax=Endozoicomonas sp. ALB032 TaxID=3403082 RepID=UPI003BB74BDC